MSRKSLAIMGLAAAATSGITLAANGVASATVRSPESVPPVASAPLPNVAASAPAPRAVVTTAAVIAAAPPRPTTYTTVPGDCLWSIGQRFDVSMYALAEANHMQLSDILYVGVVLTLPPAGTGLTADPAPVTTAAPVTHTTYTAPVTHSTSSTTHVTHTTYTAPVTHHTTYTAPVTHASSSASVSTASSASSGLQACIISRESGGNANAYNPNGHWGLYQFSASTWAAYGGSPSAYGSASAAEQTAVFNNAIARGGASNWTPYDGC